MSAIKKLVKPSHLINMDDIIREEIQPFVPLRKT